MARQLGYRCAAQAHFLLRPRPDRVVVRTRDAPRHDQRLLPGQRAHGAARPAGICRTAADAARPLSADGRADRARAGDPGHHRTGARPGDRRPRDGGVAPAGAVRRDSLQRHAPRGRAPDVHCRGHADVLADHRGDRVASSLAHVAGRGAAVHAGGDTAAGRRGARPHLLARPLLRILPRTTATCSHASFYEYYPHAPRLVASLTPVIDQTVAGAVLMILGKATLAVAAIAVFARWFGSEQRADQAHIILSD